MRVTKKVSKVDEWLFSSHTDLFFFVVKNCLWNCGLIHFILIVATSIKMESDWSRDLS